MNRLMMLLVPIGLAVWWLVKAFNQMANDGEDVILFSTLSMVCGYMAISEMRRDHD